MYKTTLRRSGSRQTDQAVTLEVRWKEVELKAPRKKDGSVKLWAVHALEINPASGEKPIEWMLLTTVAVTTFDEACERLGWYASRWGIEVFHRTLKSGCRIEDRQAATAERLEVCLAIDAVVAWRVMLLTMLARKKPDAPCTSFFTEEEYQALFAFSRKEITGVPTLFAAMLLVAAIGGFLGRKCDRFPGCTPIWRGLEKLDTIIEAWRAFGPRAKPP